MRFGHFFIDSPVHVGSELTYISARVFARASHIRFMKVFESERAFDKKSDYAANVMRADAGRIAGLVKIAGFLLQTKVYLFWKTRSMHSRSRV